MNSFIGLIKRLPNLPSLTLRCSIVEMCASYSGLQ